MTGLVAQLKEAGQDFEFYPTTDEIIECVRHDCHDWRRCSGRSLLDIGAGNGKVLKAFDEGEGFAGLYAIERSAILRDLLPEKVFVIGTDFMDQTLIDKDFDVTFCNPPYSEFVQWSEKIISESASPVVYLVIPERWTESRPIAEAIKFRDAKAESIGTFSFSESKDRAARTTVNLVRIQFSSREGDAFSRFFDREFEGLNKKFHPEKEEPETGEWEDRKKGQIVSGESYPARLVGLYNSALDHIRSNYDKVGSLDYSLLVELNIDAHKVRELLRLRMSNLKKIYWAQLFDRLAAVTDRVTSKRRQLMLDKLNKHGHVDFTLSNIHAVVIWVLKNANLHLDEQLIEVFEALVESANIRGYRSNQRVFEEDRWRFHQEKPSHICLEYRIISTYMGGINRSYGPDALADRAADLFSDLMTVGNNLGFLPVAKDRDQINTYDARHTWKSGERRVFNCTNNGKVQPLFEARAFLNGNVHIRLNQKFALSLNVEYGRLKGWLKDAHQAAEELGEDVSPESVLKISKIFGSNVRLGTNSLPMLGGGSESAEELEDTEEPEFDLKTA